MALYVWRRWSIDLPTIGSVFIEREVDRLKMLLFLSRQYSKQFRVSGSQPIQEGVFQKGEMIGRDKQRQ